MLGQWFVNEMQNKFEAVFKRIDDAIDNWAQGQLRDAEEIQKLKDEIKAMKARMGRHQKQE